MGWRNAQASMVLIGEINARWPRRDRASDGTIGDAAHATRSSDHNPWLVKSGQGIVRARDVDKDGIDAPWLVEHLRQLGARGDPRLRPGGYIIFNRRITSPDFSRWNAYNGSNPHTMHFHVSFSTDTGPAGFDSTAGWGITNAAPAPSPAAPPQPTKKGLPEMIERPLVQGLNEGRIICPTGSASGIVAQSWISVSCTGGGRVQVWFQKGARSDNPAPGTGAPVDWTIWNAERPWAGVPDGTEFIDYRITADGPGSLLIEQKPR